MLLLKCQPFWLSLFLQIENVIIYNEMNGKKTAIIMGGTSGIGREVAVQLVQTGEWQVGGVRT